MKESSVGKSNDVDVTHYASTIDGATVVEIDAPTGTLIRVNLNDGALIQATVPE